MSHPLAPLRHVYDEEPPLTAGDPAADAPVETALLDQMRRVLDARPAASPSGAALDAVAERARTASRAAGPLYAAYAASAPLDGEAEVLRQSRVALDRAIASQPRPRPSDDVEARILARAAEASGLERDAAPADPALAPVAAAYGLAGAGDAVSVEATLLASTRVALGRLPIAQPDAATLDAILAQAALASAPARPQTAPPGPAADRRAADRRAAPLTSRRRSGIWAGTAAVLAAVVAAVLFFPSAPSGTESVTESASPLAAVADVSAKPEADVAGASEESVAAPPADPAPVASAARTLARTAPRGPAASDPAPPAGPPPVAARRAASAGIAAATPRSDEASALDVGTATAWDVDDDVRLLSLRLQELRRQNEGLAWDEPAEAFGAPAPDGTRLPGVQAVREGAAPARARVRVRSDSARIDQ